MFQSFSPQNPKEPLSLGNVVTAGFWLYRSHLKSYFLLALRVSLWSLLPIFFFISVVGLIFASHANYSILAWLIVVVVGIALYLYALGQSLVNAGIISRLAFAELINQPETVAFARSQVKTKQWRFVKTALLLFVMFFCLCLFFAILLIIPLLNLLALLPVTAAFFWWIARFLIVDAILAIEENRSAMDTVSRSWDLTQGNAWRIVSILFVASLITIPLQIIVQLISRVMGAVLIKPVVTEATHGSIDAIVRITIVYLLIIIIAFLINSLILPFWQALKGAIYYDLRNRREGLNLQLRERPQDGLS